MADAIRDYGDLIDALCARRKQLGLTQRELDDRAGLQEGYCSKLESWRSRSGRGLGPVSLPLILGGLGLGIVLVEIGDTPAEAIERAGVPLRKYLASRRVLSPAPGEAA